MASDRSVVFFGPGQEGPTELVRRFGEDHELELLDVRRADQVLVLINRSFPACAILDARSDPAASLDLCRKLKGDAFTSIVPVVILIGEDSRGFEAESLAADSLVAGADEVVTESLSDPEQKLRLELVMRRAVRDVNVHPTTRLPGTVQIKRDLTERIRSGEPFGVCYADLDHFKEFNDRYGYNSGDRVIYILSTILRDIVRAVAPGGFVGHIGGDDFIFNVAFPHLETCCDEVIRLFDELIPFQYSVADREAGYFLGKDRRGNVHRVPLMTLSIGVVTNQFQQFSHTAQVSELAAEMKTYGKSLPGSVYVVDRRHGEPVSVGEDPLVGYMAEGSALAKSAGRESHTESDQAPRTS